MTARAVKPRDQRARARTGRDGEDVIEALNAACLTAGIASLWRCPTPTRVVGKPPAGRTSLPMAFLAPATVDYLGVTLCVGGNSRVPSSMLPPGRALAVEVKTRGTGVLRLAEIEPQQQACLEIVTRAGGCGVVALVVPIGLRPRPSGPPTMDLCVYAVPWSWIRSRSYTASLALDARTCEPWLVEPGRPYLEGVVRGGW